MNILNIAGLVLCVAGIACGQILFKLAARSIHSGAHLVAVLTSPFLITGVVIYGVTTLAWIWLLSKLELTRAYPFMALSFIFVPLLSTFLLGEHISPRYWAGTILIIAGLLLTLPASH